MCNNKSELDYTRIKEEFKNMGKAFPLNEKECVGLTETEKMEITSCGTYCGKCEDYGVVCDGCRNRLGRPIWFNLYDITEICSYYECCEEKECHDCSQCQRVPCGHFFEYPDPNMPSDIKQMWFKLRMENFMAQNQDLHLEIANTFEENEKFYLNEEHIYLL